MQAVETSKVDYRFLSSLNRVVLCSPCFRAGRATPVPQLITNGRKPRNVCRRCAVLSSAKGAYTQR